MENVFLLTPNDIKRLLDKSKTFTRLKEACKKKYFSSDFEMKKFSSIKTSTNHETEMKETMFLKKNVKKPFRQHSNTDEVQRRYLMHLTG